jgi:hypothetical protein
MPANRARRRALLALVVAVVLVSGLALAASLRPSVPRSTAAKPIPSASQGKTTGTRNQSQLRAPQLSLAGLRWYDFYGVELPFSAAGGPRHRSGGLAAGFAHRPSGARASGAGVRQAAAPVGASAAPGSAASAGMSTAGAAGPVGLAATGLAAGAASARRKAAEVIEPPDAG